MIETKRLFLRKHETQDFDRFWAMLNDPVAKQYTGGVTQLSYAQRSAAYKKDCAKPFSDEETEFAIINKSDGVYLGYCGFMPAKEMDGTEFFYGLCRDSWGKGYGFEAANAALAYFWGHAKHKRYIATVETENTNSIKLLVKLGFSKTGQIATPGHVLIDCYEITRE